MPLATAASIRAAIGASLKTSENQLLIRSVICTNYLPSRGIHKPVFYQQLNSPLTDPENKGKRQDGANFDTLGSWNNRLPMPVNIEQSIKKGRLIPEIDLNTFGFHSLLGRRKVNEDRYLVKELSPDLLFFGIFDGHGGHIAAEYVQSHLCDHILQQIENGEKKLGNVLRESFRETNKSLTKYLKSNFLGDDSAMTSGTTASVCLLRNGIELVVGHVGDSRATICRSGQSIRLTTDHEPDNRDEKARIEKSGGHVTWSSLGKPRVNGRLQMSRSIGDIDLKPYGVTAEPEVRSIEVIHGNDAFLILTTDGIHHVLNSQEMVNIVCACKDASEAARFVTDQALLYGSEDNCSALVIPFGAWGKYAESSKTINFTFSRNLTTGRYG